MVIGGEARRCGTPRAAAYRFNGAADGDRRRETAPGSRRSSSARFNGAADGDRRRGEPVGTPARTRQLASTEPPMVIGGEDSSRRS